MTTAPVAAEPAEEPDHAPSAPLPWAELATEHFQLLRLNGLPTDRNGPRPLRFVQFGQAERHNKNHSLLRMVISLPGQVTHKQQNHLDIRVDHAEQLVQIGDAQGLQVEPANRGLGRFMLAQAARWLHKRWPDYRITGVDLPSKDAHNEDARARRDHVLRSLGLEIAYENDQPNKARTLDAVVSQLKTTWAEEKIEPVSILDTASMLQQAEQQLQDMHQQLRERDERVSRFEREDSGLRFTITCLVAFAVFQAGLLIFIATR